MALMKKSELAQKLDVSRAYISKLIKEGKLNLNAKWRQNGGAGHT